MLPQNQDGSNKSPEGVGSMPGGAGQHNQAGAIPYSLASSSAQGQNDYGEKLNVDDGANQTGGQF